jgi:hypothetical protein
MKIFKNFETSQLSQTEQRKLVGGGERAMNDKQTFRVIDGVPIDNTTTGGPGSPGTAGKTKIGG